jgi:hypothetical protein
MNDPRMELARQVAARFAELPQVEAIALTGSLSMGQADSESDIDLYVYIHEDIPVMQRMSAANPFAEGAEFNQTYWGTEDSWHDPVSGARIEAIYWWVSWIEEQIDGVLRRHEACTGYSTVFWHSVRNGRILYDRNSWLHLLQADCQQPYPEALRRAIIAKNHPILREIESSYVQQLTAAARRGDLVSLNHRVTELLSSYFDILFAINRVPHPGEKRLVRYAEAICEKRPPFLREQISDLIASLSVGDVVAQANALIDGLDEVLESEGFHTAYRER